MPTRRTTFLQEYYRRLRRERALRFHDQWIENQKAWKRPVAIEDLSDPSGETALYGGFIDWDKWRTPGGDIL